MENLLIAPPDGEPRTVALGALLLDGRSTTGREHDGAARLVSLLGALVERLIDDGMVARALHDAARLLLRPLGRPDEALVSARAAFHARPDSLAMARGYREIARAVGATGDLRLALEAEAQLLVPGPERTALLVERGRLLEQSPEHARAARTVYEQALADGPADLEALEGLERLAIDDDSPGAAADSASRQSDAVTDPRLKAEHLARAARHLERAEELDAAWTLAASAQVHGPASPAVRFVVERLLGSAGRIADLITLRQSQIADGSLDAAAGWYDIGIMARYRLGDPAMARHAFIRAAQTTELASRECALQELVPLLAKDGEWHQVVARERDRLATQEGPGREQARALTTLRIGQLYEEKLGDVDAALEAYTAALAELPTLADARAAAGRLYQRRGARQDLLRMHELEVKYATAPVERALAQRRAGAHLVEDSQHLDQGITLLRAALEVLPDDLTAQSSLEGALIRKEAWADLCNLYEDEVKRDPSPARLYWLLTRLGTVAADRLRDRPRARQAFRRARELGEEGQELALTRLAELLEGETSREDAVELAGVLVELAARERDQTRKASLLEQAAGAYERHGILDEALELYRQGVSLSPKGHPVQAAAGRAFIRAGLYDDLLALLDRATLSVAPGERTLWLARSAEILARHLGRTEEAIHRLRQVFDLEPGHLAARQLLIGLLTAEERWADLDGILSQSKQTGIDGAVNLMRRASLAESMGELTLAADLYGRALEEGIGCAGAAWTRLTAATGGWSALAEHYGSPAPGAFSPAHTRYRAAELHAERLDKRDKALVHLEGLLVEQPGSVTALLQLCRLQSQPARQAVALEGLAASTPDAATRVQALGRQAAALDRLGQSAEAVAVREQLLALQPRDLLTQEALHSALTAQGDRTRLAALLRGLAADTRVDAGTRSTVLVELAWVLEELGQWREAVDALEAARQLEGDQPSLMARLTLPGLQEMLSDEPGHQAALGALAELLSGAERALCLRRLGERRLRAQDLEGAATSFQAALGAHPADAETLLALGALQGRLGRPEAFIDALMRAFAVEEDQTRHAHIGVALTSRLIQAGRLGPARATVERLLALTPDDLRGLILLTELDEREQRWNGAAVGLRAVSAHPAASASMQVRALSGLALLLGQRLADPTGARQTLAELTAALPLDPEMLVARLEVEQALQDPRAQATTLAQLADLAGNGTLEEGHFLLALARLQLEKLDDHLGAAVTLDRVRAPDLRPEVLESLVELATRHEAWARVAPTLERLLEEVVSAESEPGTLIEPGTEAALRRRLARLNEEGSEGGRPSPERTARAVRHYARIVALGDRTTELLERLAELETDSDPKRAIAHHQALLLRGPDRLASYRALSRLFAATGDEDAAFCAQAVLVGLGEADEEETYFYRQRRSRLRVEMATNLGDGDLALLCPELDEPGMGLLAVIDPLLGEVFPVDGSAYGPPGQPLPPTHPLRQVFDRVAKLFGVTYQLRLTSPNLGPTLEPAAPPLVMVPRSLVDNGEREHFFVAGLLLGRIALHGVITEPRRADALTPRLLELLLQAACELGHPSYVSPARGKAMFGDLKQRLERALDGAARVRLGVAVARLLAESGPGEARLDPPALMAAMNRATARAGLLLAGDPATAVAGLKRMDLPLDRPAAPGRGPTWMGTLPFVVSDEHLALRQRLGIQLRS